MSKFGDLLRAAEGKAAPTPKKVEAPTPVKKAAAPVAKPPVRPVKEEKGEE